MDNGVTVIVLDKLVIPKCYCVSQSAKGMMQTLCTSSYQKISHQYVFGGWGKSHLPKSTGDTNECLWPWYHTLQTTVLAYELIIRKTKH